MDDPSRQRRISKYGDDQVGKRRRPRGVSGYSMHVGVEFEREPLQQEVERRTAPAGFPRNIHVLFAKAGRSTAAEATSTIGAAAGHKITASPEKSNQRLGTASLRADESPEELVSKPDENCGCICNPGRPSCSNRVYSNCRRTAMP